MRGPILPCVILQSITSEKGLVWIYWLWGTRLATFRFWAYFIYAILMEWMVYLLPVGRGPQDPVGPTGGPARGHSTHWERQPKPRREPSKPSWFWSLSCTVCHCTVAHAVPVALQHASVHCPDHDAACTHYDHAVPGPAPPRSCGSGGVTLAWAAPPAVTLNWIQVRWRRPAGPPGPGPGPHGADRASNRDSLRLEPRTVAARLGLHRPSDAPIGGNVVLSSTLKCMGRNPLDKFC